MTSYRDKVVGFVDSIESDKRLLSTLSELTEVLRDGGVAVSYLNPFTIHELSGEFDVATQLSFVGEGNSIVAIFARRYSRRFESLNFDFSGIAHSVLAAKRSERDLCVFIGGSPSEVEQFSCVIENKYSSPEWLYYDGYRKHGEYINAIQSIGRAPGLIIVSTGVLRQEALALEILNSFPKSAVICSGGFIGQVGSSGKTDYYPSWIVMLRLRFLYRAITSFEIARRLLLVYPRVYSSFLFSGRYG